MPSKKSSQRKSPHRQPNGGGKWLRLTDAAHESLFSVPHLRRCIRTGRLKAYRVPGGRELRISQSDLDQFMCARPAVA